MLEVIISKHYQIVEKLGIGPFYEVFKAKHTKNQTLVAIKIEQSTSNESRLYNQVKIIKEIQGENQFVDYGVPHIYQMGTEGAYNYLIMDMMGPSLDSYFNDHSGKIDMKLTLELGQQMIQRIQLLHSKGYIHRDLRPEHFLYGRPKKPQRLYLTGFLMSKSYLGVDKKHLPYKDSKQSFTGIPRFASINAQLGIQQSRRDDIQTILYIIIYLIRGSLPWQKLKVRGKRQKIQRILQVKVTSPLKEVCSGLPEIIQQLLLYARILEYEDTPDYQYLKSGLRKARNFLKQQTIQIRENEQKSLI